MTTLQRPVWNISGPHGSYMTRILDRMLQETLPYPGQK